MTEYEPDTAHMPLELPAAEVVRQLDEWAGANAGFIKKVWLKASVGDGWPDAETLTREFFSKRRRVDVRALASDMPAPLGRLDQDRVILSVRGASYYGGAKTYLRVYVAAVRLAIDRYRTRRVEPVVREQDLSELGATTQWGRRAFDRILEGESWALFREADEDGNPVWRINPHAALALANAKTLPKYLEAQANAWWGQNASPGAQPQIRRPKRRATRQAVAYDPSTGELEWMHPAIQDAAQGLLRGGHHREAVERAAVVLQDGIRLLARSNRDGEALVNYAFSRNRPRIVVADKRTQSGQNLQRGTHLLAQGVIAAIRNPTSHRLVELSPAEAIECLAVMSFVYRQLDAAAARRARRRKS